MKLRKIRQDCYTYDSAVVAEDEARNTHPSMQSFRLDSNESYWGREDWAYSPDLVECELIGDAIKGTPKGVAVASFNAG